MFYKSQRGLGIDSVCFITSKNFSQELYIMKRFFYKTEEHPAFMIKTVLKTFQKNLIIKVSALQQVLDVKILKTHITLQFLMLDSCDDTLKVYFSQFVICYALLFVFQPELVYIRYKTQERVFLLNGEVQQ